MSIGTPALWMTSTIGSDTELQVEPTKRWTLSWYEYLVAFATPMSDLHSSLSRVGFDHVAVDATGLIDHAD